MKINKNELKKKGWSASEINHTEKLLKHNDDASKKMQIMLYWFIILAMIFLTLLISGWLIPLFMVLEGWLVFVLLFVLGLAFGAMFNNLIIHLEHLSKKHYVIAGFLIPIVAIASLFIIVKAAAFTSALFNLSIRQNPLEVSLFYVVGFLIPYVYGLIYTKKKQ